MLKKPKNISTTLLKCEPHISIETMLMSQPHINQKADVPTTFQHWNSVNKSMLKQHWEVNVETSVREQHWINVAESTLIQHWTCVENERLHKCLRINAK